MRTAPRPIGTLAVSTIPGRKGSWLVLLLESGDIKPLALFKGRKSPGLFLEALGLAKMNAHAAGRSGI